ncbi:MAG TPA: ATP-binding protein [Polyangiaceae bacterium]
MRSEQIRTLYSHGRAVFFTNIVNAAIVFAVLWDAGPRRALATFAISILAVAVGRQLLHVAFWRAVARGGWDRARWSRGFVVGSAASGAVWGGVSFVLYAHSGELSQLILPFVVAGMSAAAAGTTSVHLPSFAAFTLPALFGIAARAFAIGDGLHLAMGAMVIVYGAGLTAVASVNQRSLLDAFRLRFQNHALLEELSRARERLEETNKNLELRVEERTRAFERQAEALRDAQRLETVGRLAGGVAHDFNNLLTVVLTNANDELERGEIGPRQRQALSEMRDAAARGADLVKQLLVFGRRQGMRPETFDLRTCVSGLEPLLRRLLRENLRLEIALGTAPLHVRADPAQIEILITNLVTNARDAIEGSGSIGITTERVELTEARDGLEQGAYVALSVRDTGVGMDSETRRHAFDPFFTTKDVGKGAGLGLAAVHGIVEQSGGRIRVESEPEHGSCFRVYLPEQTPSAPAAAAGAIPASKTSPPTVLLVEDDAAVRAVAERMLRRAGYTILSAEHAEQGLELARAHSGNIDLLVTDVVMPGLSGPELARQMRALRPGISTLFISGYARDHRLVEPDAQHAVAFLPKPFTREAFDAEVARLVARPADGR